MAEITEIHEKPRKSVEKVVQKVVKNRPRLLKIIHTLPGHVKTTGSQDLWPVWESLKSRKITKIRVFHGFGCQKRHFSGPWWAFLYTDVNNDFLTRSYWFRGHFSGQNGYFITKSGYFHQMRFITEKWLFHQNRGFKGRFTGQFLKSQQFRENQMWHGNSP